MSVRKKTILALAAILLVALGLRLVNLEREPLWGDEVLSLDIVLHFDSARAMVRYLRDVEFHPPGFYLLMRPWIRLFGDSDAAVRIPSVLAGIGTVLAGAALAWRMFRQRTAALVAAAVLAVLPMQVEFSQEARPYAMYTLCGTVAALALWEYLYRSRDRRWAVVYVAASLVGVYLHYSHVFLMGATSAWWLFDAVLRRGRERERALLGFFLAHAAAFVAFAPWLSTFLYKAELSNVIIDGRPRFLRPYRLPEFFEFLSNRTIWLHKDKLIERAEILAALAFKALAVVALFRLARRAGDREAAADDTRRGLLFLAFLYVGTAVLFLVSPQSTPYAPIWYRHVLFLTVPFAVFLGWVVAASEKRWAAVLLAVFMISLIPSTAMVLENDETWDNSFALESSGAYINSQYKPGDIVLIPWAYARTNLNHYLRPEIEASAIFPVEHYGLDIWKSRETLGFLENEYQVRTSVPKEGALIREKIERLILRDDARRVWLYGVSLEYEAIHNWFAEHGWRHVYKPIGETFILDLYERPKDPVKP